MKTIASFAAATLLCVSACGCAVVAVADAAVSVTATAVKTTAKVVGAAVDAVLPDSKDSKEKDKKK